jgi:DNA (cytosine-5)-methyltransferase 1
VSAYYNEIDPFAAEWLRRLIAAGLIAPGDVDERSIEDVRPADLVGYTQCHFFAGISGWPLAFRMAGWPDWRPATSGSCPCQPHSTAAADKRRKFEDERDLWPAWLPFLRERATIPCFGEQVDDNPDWIDRMQADLESAGFAVASMDLPACAVDAPDIRMRNYFVASPYRAGFSEQCGSVAMASQFVALERSGGSAHFGSYFTSGESGRLRRTEPGLGMLVHGFPGRVDQLRAFGNAIIPELAAQVIRAYMEVCG